MSSCRFSIQAWFLMEHNYFETGYRVREVEREPEVGNGRRSGMIEYMRTRNRIEQETSLRWMEAEWIKCRRSFIFATIPQTAPSDFAEKVWGEQENCHGAARHVRPKAKSEPFYFARPYYAGPSIKTRSLGILHKQIFRPLDPTILSQATQVDYFRTWRANHESARTRQLGLSRIL